MLSFPVLFVSLVLFVGLLCLTSSNWKYHEDEVIVVECLQFCEACRRSAGFDWPARAVQDERYAMPQFYAGHFLTVLMYRLSRLMTQVGKAGRIKTSLETKFYIEFKREGMIFVNSLNGLRGIDMRNPTSNRCLFDIRAPMWRNGRCVLCSSLMKWTCWWRHWLLSWPCSLTLTCTSTCCSVRPVAGTPRSQLSSRYVLVPAFHNCEYLTFYPRGLYFRPARFCVTVLILCEAPA